MLFLAILVFCCSSCVICVSVAAARGALAIYGVRSVDSDIVNMVDSLEGMGQVMVEAQVSGFKVGL